MGIPTSGEEFAKLLEHLRKGSESAAMLAHLCRDEDKLRAKGWLAVSEMLKMTVANVTKLAIRRMQ